MRITMIMNAPDAASVELLRAEVARWRGVGHEIRPHLTFEGGDAHRLAQVAATDGSDLLIVAGGDGTLNEVANGLHAHLTEEGGTAPRLGIVPLGTGNDLAAGLEVPMEVPAAMEIAIGGREMAMDVGLVGGRCFLNVSTGGFGAEATEETGAGAKRILGSFAYLITGVKKFANIEISEARFGAGGECVYEGPFLLFAVGNSRRTGGGNWLTPRANLEDGLLDLCIVKEIPRQEFLALLPDLRAGKHLDHAAVTYRQSATVSIESASVLSVNADGEPLDGREFEYTVSPFKITVMVPQRVA